MKDIRGLTLLGKLQCVEGGRKMKHLIAAWALLGVLVLNLLAVIYFFEGGDSSIILLGQGFWIIPSYFYLRWARAEWERRGE